MKMDCPGCGMFLESNIQTCPKCDTSLRAEFVGELYKVDVAHSGEDWESARHKISRAVDQAFLQNYKGVKIIHGRGSGSGHSSVIRDKAKPLLGKLAKEYKGKLVKDSNTDGAHILYFNSRDTA